jgi:hypothetical protein
VSLKTQSNVEYALSLLTMKLYVVTLEGEKVRLRINSDRDFAVTIGYPSEPVSSTVNLVAHVLSLSRASPTSSPDICTKIAAFLSCFDEVYTISVMIGLYVRRI